MAAFISTFLNIRDESYLQEVIERVEEWLRQKCNLDTLDVHRQAEMIKTELQSRPWNNQSQYAGINYDDLKICCGYLHRFAACHSSLVRRVIRSILRENPEGELMRALTDKKCLKIVSAGGGPGNDLLGFCSAIADYVTDLEELHLTVVDLKGGWKDSFQQMMSEVRTGADYGKLGDFFEKLPPAKQIHNFVQQDLCLGVPAHIREADFVLMVKVLSNVHPFQKVRILQNIFLSMKEGAIFVFVDIDAIIVSMHSILMKEVFSDYSRKFFSPIFPSEGINRSSYEICILKKDQLSIT